MPDFTFSTKNTPKSIKFYHFSLEKVQKLQKSCAIKVLTNVYFRAIFIKLFVLLIKTTYFCPDSVRSAFAGTYTLLINIYAREKQVKKFITDEIQS